MWTVHILMIKFVFIRVVIKRENVVFVTCLFTDGDSNFIFLKRSIHLLHPHPKFNIRWIKFSLPDLLHVIIFYCKFYRTDVIFLRIFIILNQTNTIDYYS